MPFNRHIASLFVCLTCIPATLFSQDELIRKADALHKDYKFQEAASLYMRAAEAITDSTALYSLEKSLIQCENGDNFLRYVSTPTTSACQNVPLKELVNWLPEMNGGWSAIPNPLDSASCQYQKHTFFPAESDRIIYAGPAADGKWDIFEVTREAGTQWSAPEPIPELNSSGNEIYPILSASGKIIWFASDGHPGIGGYDIFISKWDDSQKKWSTPENLGFPYSSTSDDILYFDTPDGCWSALVSNRDAAAGTATIYILEQESNPVKSSISDISEIQTIAHLEVKAHTGSAPSVQSSTDSPADSYTAAVLNMKNCQKSYQELLDELDRYRAEYEQSGNQSQISGLTEKISELESKSSQAKERVDAAVQNVRNEEMNLLKKGIVPPAVDDSQFSSDNSTAQAYKFERTAVIAAPRMETRIPVPVFDYTFRIQKESEIAPEGPLPDGIVYQIQMMALSSKPTAARFKGITPAFIRKNKSGSYIGSAGLFRSYEDASKAVSKVKAKGFSQAFVVAFKDGKSISVKTARLQAKATDGMSYNVILDGYSEGLPSIVKTTISTTCTKDIAKSSVDGQVVYIIGPFAQKSEAETLVSALKAAGAEDVTMEAISK